MVDQAKRFEIAILRPLQIAFSVAAVVLLFEALWVVVWGLRRWRVLSCYSRVTPPTNRPAGAQLDRRVDIRFGKRVGRLGSEHRI